MLDIIRQNAQSWGIKVAFAVIILVFILGFGFSSRTNKSATVALVNDEPILIKDFEDIYRRSVENLRQQNPKVSSEDLARLHYKAQILNQMISTALLLQEAKRLGVTVSDVELSDAIRDIAVFHNAEGKFDHQVYEHMLGAQRLSPAAFESDFRKDLVVRKLHDYVTLPAEVNEDTAHAAFAFAREERSLAYAAFPWAAFVEDMKVDDKQVADYYAAHKDRYQLPPRIAVEYLSFTPAALAGRERVSDEEVQAYYDKNKERYFFEDEKVKARHILIQAAENAPDAEVAAARDKIMKIYLRIQKGEDFGKMAKEYSEGPSKTNGGELGWFGRGQMVEPFEEAAFGLKPGQVSQPVRTRFGWHLIQVEEHKEAHQKPLPEVEDEIRKRLAEDKAGDRLSDALDQAIEQVVAGQELDQVADSMGLSARKTKLFTRQQAGAALGVDAQGAGTLFDTQAGVTLDAPLSTQQGYMLVKVLERRDVEFKPLEQLTAEIRDTIKREAGMAKAKEAADAALKTIATENRMPEGAKATESEFFGRTGFVPGLGMNPTLVGDAFKAAKIGDWLPAAYQVDEGYVVARVADVKAPDEKRWEQERELWLSSMRDNQRRQLFQAFAEGLHKQAKIELLNPTVADLDATGQPDPDSKAAQQ
ncbi:MAG: SurA N-terminal domain-containing protein [Desulfovibrionaceae bacterium]|jgi:peptidyl-prolyl cis-trans isomerase D|nr:SurA N-terminal domain-containing protein [Desulfovibrionaceae bacterium]